MNRKITVQQITTERTQTGGLKQKSFSDLFTDWCDLAPVSGAKRLNYRQFGYNEPYDIELANRSNVEPEKWPKQCQAKIDGEVFQITSAYTSKNKMKIIMEVTR